MVSLYQAGLPGDGVKMDFRFTVDNTAPEITGIYKNLKTGDLKVQLKDNAYTAVVQVRNLAGKVLATVVPEQTEPGQALEVTIPLEGITVGAACNVVVGDYAKNERAYTVEYGGQEEDFSGRMFGFTNISYRNGYDNAWMEIDPQTVWYVQNTNHFGGTSTAGLMDLSITAAAYAFPNKEDVTMTYVHDESSEGLLIGYGTGEQVELYYIDLTDGQMQCRKVGNLPAYTDIASIYTEYDLNLEPTQMIRKGTDTESSSLLPMSYEQGQEYVMEEQADGSTNSIGPATPVSVAADEDGTLTVTVTAKNAKGEDVTAHSGSMNVAYDADALELTDVQIGAAFRSVVKAEGSVAFAYADLEARDTAAVLTLKVKQYGQTTLLVNTLQAEDENSAYTETLSLCADCPSKAYADLNLDSWYHEYTDYVIANGLMQGWEQKFDPAGSANRAMLVQVLYNLASRPEAGTDSGFADVDANSWFAEAVTWARSAGVVNGVDDDHFAPGRAVTREEAVTMLYRYAKDYAKIDMIPGADLSAITDQGRISGYARPAMEWAVAAGLVKGMEDGTILPQGTSNRAQLAALLTRLTRDILK